MQESEPVTFLKAEFTRRCRKNPKYSLRAFAKAMGMSHTLVSLILSGKRTITPGTAGKIARSLGLNPAQRKSLETKTARPAPSEDQYTQISLDQFELISDWHHYAILSVLEIPGAKFEAKWIAQRLGITEVHAKWAMERLQRMGLIEFRKGRWRQTGLPIKVENTDSTAATKKFHQQLLERATHSLENDPIETRDFSAITFAMDRTQVEHALKRIRQFRRALCKELEERAEPNEVYQLMVQLFPLSRKGDTHGT